ncbi:MAG: hypothetical protein U5L11_09995 [Arhodomonas sp.]|nr:hypothetical protein [Arhodomonas sp.]
MAGAAERLADAVVLTSDNPRGEAPERILADMRAGLADAGAAMILADRGEAIHAAVTASGAGDVVLIAGKGHEACQVIGDRVLPFSDRDEAAAALAKREGAWSR